MAVPNPFQGDLDGYKKIPTPWKDDSGQNLYFWAKDGDNSETVPIYIGSDKNLKDEFRFQSFKLRSIMSCVVTNTIHEATVRVIQRPMNSEFTFELELIPENIIISANGYEEVCSGYINKMAGDIIVESTPMSDIEITKQ